MYKFVISFIHRFDWKFFPSSYFSLFCFFAIWPCLLFFPIRLSYENSLIENVQLVVLFISFLIAISSKVNKKFFHFIAMLVVVLFLRELNYGRVFFPVPGVPDSFLSWKEILPNFYWLPRFLYASFMLFVLIYFFVNKLFKNLFYYVFNYKIAMWDFIFLFFGIFLGSISEMYLNNQMLEELTETLFYVAFASIIWIYSRILIVKNSQ